jgi:Tol biopolymer transport system component
MSLASGTRLGPYQILAKLGEGGMGEVYRATDSHLKRSVAIKVLPASMASDADRLARFQREAEVLAALNHPNIAAIYGLEKTPDLTALVMELVEGDDLSTMIGRGPIALSDALPIAKQIADALEAAHEQGIIHRDLKPANIKVRADGTVKVLDFGLAKAMDPVSVSSSGLANSPTMTSPAMTAMGMILGTAAYMSPEQAKGRAVDRRADIWAFGVVLSELLTGQQLFEAEDVSETLAAVLTRDVSQPSLPANIPPRLRALLRDCLVRDPKQRLRDIGEARRTLDQIIAGAPDDSATVPANAVAAGHRDRRPWLLVAGVALVVAAMTAAVVWSLQPVPALPPALEVDLSAPPGHVAEQTSALSPDGLRFALTARDAAGQTQLWLRTLESGVMAPIAGTDEARHPFWSPDGTQIGFFAGGRLKAVTVASGRVRVICDALGGRQAGTWSAQDVIVFSVELGERLKRVSAGGNEMPVDLKTSGFRPHFLPDGRHYLFHGGDLTEETTRGISVADLESDIVVPLAAGSDAKYADGYLLFVRSSSLLAQPFDLVTRTLGGEPVVLAEVGAYPAATGPNYTVAGGLIATRRSVDTERRLVWYGRDGVRLGEIPEDGDWRNPSLSPDDSRVAAQRNEREGTGSDLWVLDVARGTTRAVSAEVGQEGPPAWSLTGDRVIFVKNQFSDAPTLVAKPLDGGAAETLRTGFRGTFIGPMPDRRSVLSFSLVEGNRDILITPVDGTSPPVAFARSTFNETQPALSPDGRWLAYVSDELGINEQSDVYVQAFPGGGKKVQVSADTLGGQQPRWGRDGRELFYVAPDKRIIAVPVASAGDTLRLGQARPLFQTMIGSERGLGTRASYDVTRDGKKFIVAESRSRSADVDRPFTLLVNWRSAVAKGVRPVDGPAGR